METIREEELEWVLCPSCRGKTRTKLLPATELKNYPLFCPKCKRTVLVNAAGGKIEIIHTVPDV